VRMPPLLTYVDSSAGPRRMTFIGGVVSRSHVQCTRADLISRAKAVWGVQAEGAAGNWWPAAAARKPSALPQPAQRALQDVEMAVYVRFDAYAPELRPAARPSRPGTE
jgi:hypothetical protein